MSLRSEHNERVQRGNGELNAVELLNSGGVGGGGCLNYFLFVISIGQLFESVQLFNRAQATVTDPNELVICWTVSDMKLTVIYCTAHSIR